MNTDPKTFSHSAKFEKLYFFRIQIAAQRSRLFHERCFQLQVFARVLKFLHLNKLHHRVYLMKYNSQPCCIKQLKSRSIWRVSILARKESRAARVRRAGDSMLDIPAWAVRRKITRDWKSFFQVAASDVRNIGKTLILSRKAKLRKIYQKLVIFLRHLCYDTCERFGISPASFLRICRTISLHVVQ